MISIEIILLSIHLNRLSIDCPFKPQRNLLIRKDFNWNRFTFNSFESTFNWFPFLNLKNIQNIYWEERLSFSWNHFTFNSFESTFNWFSFWTSETSIDKKVFQLKSFYILSVHLNLLSIGFPFKPQRNLLIRQDFNWPHFTFNSFASTFNWFFF